MNSRFDPAMYAAQVQVAYARAWRSPWPYVIALGWVLAPFAVSCVLHPSDVIRLQAFMQGLDKPHWFSQQQLTAGCVQAVFALGVLALVQICATTLFYRRVQMFVGPGPVAAPPLWPIAFVATGVVGNAMWLAGTGQIDLQGWVVGCSSAALAVACERVMELLGKRFVFGAPQGAHP
jgi:tryptophan-rich sensory protein